MKMWACTSSSFGDENAKRCRVDPFLCADIVGKSAISYLHGSSDGFFCFSPLHCVCLLLLGGILYRAAVSYWKRRMGVGRVTVAGNSVEGMSYLTVLSHDNNCPPDRPRQDTWSP